MPTIHYNQYNIHVKKNDAYFNKSIEIISSS